MPNIIEITDLSAPELDIFSHFHSASIHIDVK